MKEEILTKILVEKLESGEIKKIIKSNLRNSSVNYFREMGTNAFRADIFISLNKITDTKNNRAHFIAIEVKIKDWKQGLYQAWKYNAFAEKSYLAIYKKYAKNIDIKMFEKYNVGLIIFDENSILVKNIPKNNSFKKKEYSIELRKHLQERMTKVTV